MPGLTPRVWHAKDNMEKLPPYITGIIEGGKNQSEFSAEEMRELEEALASLSPEVRAEVEAMLAPPGTDEFMFKNSEDNSKPDNEY